jgi:pyruvate dehydrogenase E2 component (dihydrolipoamide acetyltransferase)
LVDFSNVSFEDKEVSNIRKVIADRLCYSK